MQMIKLYIAFYVNKEAKNERKNSIDFLITMTKTCHTAGKTTVF